MPELKFPELMQTMRGFQESRVLLTAVELDLFTAVGEGAPAETVAARLDTAPRASAQLLNALVSIGALTKRDGVYHNTGETARFLVTSSPDCLRAGLLHSVHLWETWNTLTERVRTGTPHEERVNETRRPEWTRAFIAAMDQRARGEAGHVAQAVPAQDARRMLDIGGGSGIYSIAFARAYPELMVDVFDLPAVVQLTQEYVRAAGLAERIGTRSGDMRTDELGAGYDLALLSAICHMFSPEENQELFGRCYRALAPGGRLLMRDFILDPDGTRPRHAALFALNMLVNTPHGSTYTEAEYTEWLKGAGFSRVERVQPPEINLMVAWRE
ncbi:MAG: methyltransferase [Bryobacteraceae bacterium]